MRIFIQQPSYLPWIGYFEQIYNVDIFVFFDDVQYTKKSWKNRNKIKTSSGETWLTVPVHYEFREQLIKDIKIDYSTNWVHKHLKTIKIAYKKSNFFADIYPLIEEVLIQKPLLLVDLDIQLILSFAKYLNIKKKFMKSSELYINENHNEKRIIAICRKLNCNILYNGTNAKNILDINYFKEAGIEVQFQDFKHPIYSQLHEEFIPYLSIIDLLFNCGPESGKYIWGENEAY